MNFILCVCDKKFYSEREKKQQHGYVIPAATIQLVVGLRAHVCDGSRETVASCEVGMRRSLNSLGERRLEDVLVVTCGD